MSIKNVVSRGFGFLGTIADICRRGYTYSVQKETVLGNSYITQTISDDSTITESVSANSTITETVTGDSAII